MLYATSSVDGFRIRVTCTCFENDHEGAIILYSAFWCAFEVAITDAMLNHLCSRKFHWCVLDSDNNRVSCCHPIFVLTDAGYKRTRDKE